MVGKHPKKTVLIRVNPWQTPFILAALLVSAAAAAPDSFRHAGTEFEAARSVVLKAEELRPVVVVEFLHQGLIRLDNKKSSGDAFSSGNVAVVAKNGEIAPSRILQLGPGDFCRLAFETIAKQTSYEVFYGGEPPDASLLPKWKNGDGLLLETRQYVDCDLNSLDSLRSAFEKAAPSGADYVEGVYHAGNPFSLTPGPFMSRYTGTLYIASGGDYTFWSSSRDCSFLLIDDKLVASAPGRHGPEWQARPELGKTVNLAAGGQKFEYLHAAAGDESLVSLSWVQGAAGGKPRPALLPPAVFRAESIFRAEAAPLALRTQKTPPDFSYKIAGEVPLPDEPLPLVGASFQQLVPPGVAAKAKFKWDFGDGQTSELPNPDHVYLRPGLYAVSFSVKGTGRAVTVTNRISVERPLLDPGGKDKPHTLDNYLPLLTGYDAAKLDAAAARQLFLAFLWKADLLATAIEDAIKETDANGDAARSEEPAAKSPSKIQSREERLRSEAAARKASADKSREAESRRADMQKYLTAAVDAAKKSLIRDAEVKVTDASGDADVYALAELAAATARIRLADSRGAFDIWSAAARRVKQPLLAAKCELAAADIAVGDLLEPKTAESLLRRAEQLLRRAEAALQKGQDPQVAAKLDRVWGDYRAAMGDGTAARKSYIDAQGKVKSAKSQTEQTAWRGAHSRSAEQYIKSGHWERAFAELLAWQESFPADKAEGYLSLLMARYWMGREKYPQAVALGEQLLSVNPNSPHADQMLFLAAACELKQNRPQKTQAMLHSLINDYPGSPLVPEAKKKLAELGSSESL